MTIDTVEDDMDNAVKAIYNRVRDMPGQLDATDLILALRSATLGEPTVRRAMWQLLSSGDIDMDDDLHLVPTEKS